MAAQPVPNSSTEKKRVKVYELRNNDWFDRGTGFCTADFNSSEEDGQHRDPRVYVESEDQPDRVLLETRICKDDGFHKQQETLIVWTEPSNGVDMALSFQEAEGCTMIWKFINSVQQQFHSMNAQDDTLSDDLAMDMPNPISLPPISLGNLPEIESQMRMLSGTANGRDALTKYVLTEDLIGKLIPLVSEAEDLEGLIDLHRLCNIMKTIILLNDTSIIEHSVSDDCVIGVVGALEYDPDFPTHKANHRAWLEGEGRYKEVVRIEDPQILTKIHQTYRLQYLKDVVLARILDDNTFSVLNSLIFFNQVDIVQHLLGNGAFLNELFSIFTSGQEGKRKKEAVLFIQQCCAIAKNLQPPSRQTLYNNFLTHGLLRVINFGLRHSDVAVRVGATDILFSMIDHDAQMIRQTIYCSIRDKIPPLTDSLIDLLLVEVDLGVKSQITDALRVLLDQGPPLPAEAFAKANGEYAARAAAARMPQSADQQEHFIELFYEHSAAKLFQPLIALKGRENMDFSVQQASMFTYLIDILCFFVRQHQHRSKFFIMNHEIVSRVGQLLSCPEKFLKLVAIRFFRQLIGLQDEFYIKHVSEKKVVGLILQELVKVMPRDNLLSSSCLEFFEFIKKENIKDLVKHIVENHRDQIEGLTYLELFRTLIVRYDQTSGFTANVEFYMENGEDMHNRRRSTINPRTGALMEQMAMEQADEEYWNASDDDDDLQVRTGDAVAPANGSPSGKPLVDYASDEDLDDNIDAGALSADEDKIDGEPIDSVAKQLEEDKPGATVSGPPERLSEKRRREESEEDDLGEMIQNKRRNSTSASSNSSATSGAFVRKKKSLGGRDGGGGGGPKKIAISLSSNVKAGGEQGSNGSSDES